ncbi:hypothetical protein Agub_g1068, partial [Astrephomene gubernaculifera]
MSRSKRSRAKGRHRNRINPSQGGAEGDARIPLLSSVGTMPERSSNFICDSPKQIGSHQSSQIAEASSLKVLGLKLAADKEKLPMPVRSASDGPKVVSGDGYDSLLEGLTGRDLQTAKLVVQALRDPEDLSRLRRLAVTHGFVNDRIRAVVWPRLLGIHPPAGGSAGGGTSLLALGQPPARPPASSSPRPSSSRPAGSTLPPAPSTHIAPAATAPPPLRAVSHPASAPPASPSSTSRTGGEVASQ